MHSFASALIAAALATLTSAAPVGLPVNLPANLAAGVPPAALPANLASVPLPPGAIPPISQVSSVENVIGSATGAVRVRDVASKITNTVNFPLKTPEGELKLIKKTVTTKDQWVRRDNIWYVVLTE